jgi:hypothetical protein
MKRFSIIASIVLCAAFTCGFALGQAPEECPWKFATGHWRLTDSTGNEADVVWKKTAGDALIGRWKGEDGRAIEITGWRPDRNELVATGYGPNGEYWEVVFTTVTEKMIKGKMIQRTPDGVIKKGTWQVTKKSDDEMPTLFVGTRDGQEVTEKGSFKRVE